MTGGELSLLSCMRAMLVGGASRAAATARRHLVRHRRLRLHDLAERCANEPSRSVRVHVSASHTVDGRSRDLRFGELRHEHLAHDVAEAEVHMLVDAEECLRQVLDLLQQHRWPVAPRHL
jgi:hypothetical protein